jgi:hypothetical protein
MKLSLIVTLCCYIYKSSISANAKGACDQFLAQFNQPMHRQYCMGIGSIARYDGEAMDGPPICHAFIMAKMSFDFLRYYFTYQAMLIKTRGRTTLRYCLPIHGVV